MPDRKRLTARIRQMRRAAETSAAASRTPASSADPNGLRALQSRVEHLERLVEGLQDSVHREAQRSGRRLAELEAQIQPAALNAALSKDARERGL